jgi:hypothetical protein
MNTRLPFLVLLLCPLCEGCEVAGSLSHATVCELGRHMDETLEKIRDRRLANKAWEDFETTCGGHEHSKHYARGFKCGFEDYLFAGGSGDPPLFPPQEYWGVGYETPDGYLQIQDWFAGYRQGAAAARESGYRQFVILPMARPATPMVAPSAQAGIPPVAMPLPGSDADPDSLPGLPVPQKLETGAPQPAPDW